MKAPLRHYYGSIQALFRYRLIMKMLAEQESARLAQELEECSKQLGSARKTIVNLQALVTEHQNSTFELVKVKEEKGQATQAYSAGIFF
jgi:methylthioribose-1-phosphate isomerase